MPADSNEKLPQQFRVPQITNADLRAFHERHFSDAAIKNFGTRFLSAQETESPQISGESDAEDCYQDDDDDGLGYYPDGVKRTLTDEQIAMFRHSELEALRRQRDKQAQARPPPSAITSNEHPGIEVREREKCTETAYSESEEGLQPPRKSKKGKGGRQQRREPKPDLRKRTWDVVDTGLETLSYDE